MKFVLILLCALLSSCFNTKDADDPPFDTEKFRVRLIDGETRLVLRTFSNTGTKYRSVTPMLVHIRVEKDTTIQGLTGKIVHSTAWERWADSTTEFHWRQWVVVEGSLAWVYEFKQAEIPPIFHGLLKGTGYDTNVFSNRSAFAPFPLSVGRKLNINDTADPFYHPAQKREFLGMDTLVFGGESHVSGVFGQTFLVDVHAKSWIASIGLLKAEIDYGKTDWTDSLGNILDTGVSREEFELLVLNPTEARIAEEREMLAKKQVDIGP